MPSLITAELKDIASADVEDLESFRPEGPFGFSFLALVGPSGEEGEESFDIVLCTPDWFAANMQAEIVSGRHYLFTKRYDYHALKTFLEQHCSQCQGRTWDEVALKVGRLGFWEFEDYKR